MLWGGMGCEVGTAVRETQVRAEDPGLYQGRGQYHRMHVSGKAAGRRWRSPGGAGTWGGRNPTPICSGPCSSPVTESSFMPPPPAPQHQGGPQHWLSVELAGVTQGGSRLCPPREWCPQDTGSRREGADRHQNIQLPFSICPYFQVPLLTSPWGFPQPGHPCG